MSTASSRNLIIYVYYKIAASDRISCLLGVKNLTHLIKSHYPNLKIQHQKRSLLDSEKKETWLEMYDGIPEEKLEKFTNDLSEFAERNGLPKERRYEVFVNLNRQD